MSRRITISVLLVLLLGLTAMAPGESGDGSGTYDLEAVRLLAVQSGGRFKPLDTQAREAVRLITGKAKFQKQDPVFTVLLWMANPQQAVGEPLIEVRNLALKKELGLDEDGRWYSFQELVSSPALHSIQDRLRARSEAGAKMDAKDQDASTLLDRMTALDMLLKGRTFTVVPNPAGLKDNWYSLEDVQSGLAQLDPEQLEALQHAYGSMFEALRNDDPAAFNQHAATVASTLEQVGPYPDKTLLAREVHYNNFHPFRAAWLLYTVAALLLLFPGTTVFWLGIVATGAGFALHGYGFYLRTLIGGRAPVTNMYESVVWAAFGVVFFALILGLSRRNRTVLVVANVCAVLALILADNLPAVLDPSIRPLAPVLRNNFWLTIHVVTIMLGYAAFLLALGLGHVVLWKALVRPGEAHKELDQVLYRTLQVGVLLLAAGTILGGVWANYSWGRFWGWDPKEVWALIALLGYLALLHGRYAGWIRSFEMGVGSVVAFLLVLMAWYGVNFVLGAGLHSYGFGAGGVEYVVGYVLLEMVFVGVASLRHYRFKKSPVKQQDT